MWDEEKSLGESSLSSLPHPDEFGKVSESQESDRDIYNQVQSTTIKRERSLMK